MPWRMCECSWILQARDALKHAYFDDLDKEAVDKLENEAIRVHEG